MTITESIEQDKSITIYNLSIPNFREEVIKSGKEKRKERRIQERKNKNNYGTKQST